MTAVQRINEALRKVPVGSLYIVSPLPALWWLYLGLTGGLGREPISALEHRLGEFALQLLILGLAVTPLRERTGLNLLRFRRAIGLITFFYVVLHLSVWLFLDVQIAAQIWADIVKRPYITIGMLAFVLLVPLAATSNDWAVRKIGALRWRRLHKLSYAAALLAGLHFVMLTKGWQLEPLLYFAAILAVLSLRMIPKRRRVAV